MSEPSIERVLFTEEQIEQRVREVAAEISAKYAGRELKLIGVLKGSVFFLTALARELTIPTRVDFLGISSFANQRGAPGMVRIAKDLDDSVEGEDIMLVEDIVDTGFTTRYLLQHLAGRGPNSLSLCTLLDRTTRRIVQVPVDYRCFEIPDRFVVGFGLDHKQLYRNLKYIAVLNLERTHLLPCSHLVALHEGPRTRQGMRYSSRRISSGFWPRMRKLAIHPAAFAISAVATIASRLGRIGNEICASSIRLSSRFANPLASRLPMIPATAPRIRNSTEKMRLTRQRVAPSVLRITTSRMRRKRVPATLEDRIIAPARIANIEMKRITSAI